MRLLILDHRRFAVLICVAALALRVLVPAGFMVSAVPGGFAIMLCPGMAPPAGGSEETVMAGMHGDMADHAPSPDHGKAELPCAFTALSTLALGGVDPILLIVAIAFVMAIARRPAPPRPRAAIPHLRPPSRGPPVLS